MIALQQLQPSQLVVNPVRTLETRSNFLTGFQTCEDHVNPDRYNKINFQNHETVEVLIAKGESNYLLIV